MCLKNPTTNRLCLKIPDGELSNTIKHKFDFFKYFQETIDKKYEKLLLLQNLTSDMCVV